LSYYILFTSAGQRISLVRAFQKEIKLLDQTAKVYTVDLNPTLAPAWHVSDGYQAVKKVLANISVTKNRWIYFFILTPVYVYVVLYR